MAKSNNNLPTLAQLHLNPAQAYKNDALKALLNNPPSEKWIKKHPIAKVKNDEGKETAAKYLPIDKVELMLDMIFQKWKVEVLDVKLILNSVVVTIRLHYLDPTNNEWMFHDGVGAKSIQMDAGANLGDITKVKDAGVMMAVPSAKSYAIKDAAEHLGELFGRSLNRRNVASFAGAYTSYEETPVAGTNNNNQNSEDNNYDL